MKQSDAMAKIRIEYFYWKQKQPTINEQSKFLFYLTVAKDNPQWLDFPYPGDKWQCVNGMLIDL